MKFVIATALVFALVMSALGCSGKENNSNVIIEVRKITLSEVRYTKGIVDVNIRIENSNPSEVILDRIEYGIYFGHEGKWILLGQGEKESVEIETDSTVDFTITTVIENSRIVSNLLEDILGTEPTQMKVDGHAWITTEEDTFEIAFEKVDNEITIN
ncbi:MAG: hypothetical protein SVM79_01230 [Chloroflexota bacterium]|nr:hypothetical protein [Chloroflexota bacterium]